ncbi:MAG: hypothetical protein ABI895_37590 [Deltaproteobacteria bacterium]
MMRWLGPCLFVVLGSLACGESRLLEGYSEQDTRLRLTPESFRGNLACAPGTPGALQTYAVTFREALQFAQQTDAGLYRGTSALAACDRAVVLSALPGRLYVADIYGFDRAFSGSEPALDEARWTASCGRADDVALAGPTRAVYGALVPMTGCTTFSGPGNVGAGTQLLVDQAGALGDLQCGSGPGQVSRLEGVLAGTRVSARCGDPLAFDLPSEEQFYTIELTAFEASSAAIPAPPLGDPLDASLPASPADATADAATGDSAALDAGLPPAPGQGGDSGAADAGAGLEVARWRSQCSGTSVPGASAVATCDPLQAIP